MTPIFQFVGEKREKVRVTLDDGEVTFKPVRNKLQVEKRTGFVGIERGEVRKKIAEARRLAEKVARVRRGGS